VTMGTADGAKGAIEALRGADLRGRRLVVKPGPSEGRAAPAFRFRRRRWGGAEAMPAAGVGSFGGRGRCSLRRRWTSTRTANLRPAPSRRTRRCEDGGGKKKKNWDKDRDGGGRGGGGSGRGGGWDEGE